MGIESDLALVGIRTWCHSIDVTKHSFFVGLGQLAVVLECIVLPGARGYSTVAGVRGCVDLVQEALDTDFLCRLLRWWCCRLCCLRRRIGCRLLFFLAVLPAAFGCRISSHCGGSRVHSLLLRVVVITLRLGEVFSRDLVLSQDEWLRYNHSVTGIVSADSLSARNSS